jgi:hypothetical protein
LLSTEVKIECMEEVAFLASQHRVRAQKAVEEMMPLPSTLSRPIPSMLLHWHHQFTMVPSAETMSTPFLSWIRDAHSSSLHHHHRPFIPMSRSPPRHTHSNSNASPPSHPPPTPRRSSALNIILDWRATNMGQLHNFDTHPPPV